MREDQIRIPLKVKDKNGWKILKAEVPAGLNLKPGLGADVAVQLLAGKVLQQRLLHAAHHLVLDVQLEGEEGLQGGTGLAPLGLHRVPGYSQFIFVGVNLMLIPAEAQSQLSHWSVKAGLICNPPVNQLHVF